MSRWQDKADALGAAWHARYGAGQPGGRDLTTEGLALGLGPAQLETRCGDAWPGPDGLVGTADDERNWGACTLRSLNAVEHAVLKAAGIYPTIGTGHNQRAAAAMAALADAGMTPPSGLIGTTGIAASSATIHCDSRTVKDANGKPQTIPHFVWFANFATHVDGAAYYLHLLGSSARLVLQNAGTAHELAAAMYRRGYYGGFKPHSTYTAADGTVHDGNAENIAAYERLILYWLPQIKAALAPPVPTTIAPRTLRHGMRGDDVKALQHALNGFVGATWTLKEDGVFGPRTESAVIQYQRMMRLKIDGVVGPQTRVALGLS